MDIIDVQSGNIIKSIPGNYSEFQISSDNKFIVSRNIDTNSLDIIDVQSGNIIKSISGSYNYIQLSSDNKFIAAVNINTNSLDIIDVQSGTISKSISGDYYDIQISSDNKFIVARNLTVKPLNIIDIQSGAISKSISGNYRDIQISSDNKFIVARNLDTNSLDIIDVQSGTISKSISGSYNYIQISFDNKFIVARNLDTRSLDIIDVKFGNIIESILGRYYDIQISFDNKFIAGTKDINNTSSLEIIYLPPLPNYEEIATFIINNIAIIPTNALYLIQRKFSNLINVENTDYDLFMQLYQKLSQKIALAKEIERHKEKKANQPGTLPLSFELSDQEGGVLGIINKCLGIDESIQAGIRVTRELQLQLPESHNVLNLAPDGDVDMIAQETFNELAKDNPFIRITRVNKGPFEHYYLTDSLDRYHKTAREDHDNNPYLQRQQFDDNDPANRQPVKDRLDFILVSPSNQIDRSTFALIKPEEIINFLLESISTKKLNVQQEEEAENLFHKLSK